MRVQDDQIEVSAPFWARFSRLQGVEDSIQICEPALGREHSMFSRMRRHLVGLVALGSLVASGGALYAQRACLDNFTESGEWSSGKSFKTFLEAKETTYDKAFLAVARAVAAEGFLGLTSNKEIGVVSAYQEDNGKKSTITAVVSESAPGSIRVEATFSLARGLRSPSAAIRDYLCKLVEPALSDSQKSSSGPESSGIALRVGDKDVPLSVGVGEFRKAGFGPVLVLYFDFEGARAETRSGNRRPSILLRSAKDPNKAYLLVRCESGGEKRSIKVGSAGSILKMGVTGGGDLAPDKDWTIPFSSVPEGQGAWRLTPTSDLPAGEYGLWDVQGYGVALFGVD